MASQSSTFSSPPLDGSLTIPEIYDWHYENNPEYPAFAYADEHGAVRRLAYHDVVPAVHRAGKHVADAIGIDLAAPGDPKDYPVVAVLSTADTVTTVTALIGMMRLGVTVFTISPRFSANVVAHLMAKTGVKYVFVSVEQRLHELARDANAALGGTVTMCHMPTYDELYLPRAGFQRLPTVYRERTAAALIVHSSCSTSAFPKAICWSVGMCLQQAMLPVTSAYDLTGHTFGCHSIELFHGIGLLFLFWIPAAGIVMSTFRPACPAIKPTPEAVYSAWQYVRPTYVLAPTRFVETWAEDPEKVAYMKTLTGMLSGGKLIKKRTGDMLAREGVHLRNMYGSTESGHISAVPSAPQGPDWMYFELSPQVKVDFQPIGDGSYRCVVIATATHEPPTINTSVDGQDAYDSGDLFMPHPTKAGHWRFLGRADARIMLSTGEVVDPSSLEDMVRDHPSVASAVVFGQSRGRLGVLLELKPEHAIPEDDEEALAGFREKIWPIFELANDAVPKHSRIGKEMIIVARRAKPFPYNQKGSPRRPEVLIDYSSEIDALYDNPAKDVLYTDCRIASDVKIKGGDVDGMKESGAKYDNRYLTWALYALTAAPWLVYSLVRGLSGWWAHERVIVA